MLSPSSFVTQPFLARGFKPEQILRNVYPVNLSCFSPAREPRPAARPLTLISTGRLSLRKGTPYLLEAFRLVRNRILNTRLLLTQSIQESALPILTKYKDLPVVASQVGGIPDYLIPGKNGLLFPVDDLSGCVRAIRDACAHPLFSKGLVDLETLTQTRAYLSPERMANNFLKAYEAALR